jgi:hypothetical protein
MNPKVRFAVLLVFTFSFSARADWNASRLEVHEWVVSQFDWSQGKKPIPDFPDFFYTDKAPGGTLGTSTNRVKDMEADDGTRTWTKPVLYFYGPGTLGGHPQQDPIPVGVEVRFKNGQALAWWPQVNLYRTPQQVAKATEPDPDRWNLLRMEKYRATLKSRLTPEQFEKSWAYTAKSRFIPNHLGVPLSDFGGMGPFPDDERFQLVWDHLSVSGTLPKGAELAGVNLPDSNWVKIARHVDSDYISNGREMEKFVFYEGKTPESPAIALMTTFDPTRQGPTLQVLGFNWPARSLGPGRLVGSEELVTA